MPEAVEIVTFKMDKALKQRMRGVSNRSAFIRTAILHALDEACPFCKGSGVLTAHKKKHLQDFLKNHIMTECRTCGETIFRCQKGGRGGQKRK